MANATATASPIFVDHDTGQRQGDAEIRYEKTRDQELWERYANGAWQLIDAHVRTGRGDDAGTDGVFAIALTPGQFYELNVFDAGHGPCARSPISRARVRVFCLWKTPQCRPLIRDVTESFGGTWYRRCLRTHVPTTIVDIGVSRTPPVIDATGLPRLTSRDGAPTTPLAPFVDEHQIELNPLLPGHLYFFAAIVADALGNWEVLQAQFTTLRRKLTVEFPALHVYNDGDPFSEGEGEFWFQVYAGDRTQPSVITEFHRATTQIDDWRRTDRPYPLGFVHDGPPEVVDERRVAVSVSSWGIEHDGFLEADEGAWSRDKKLPLPAGRFVEDVAGRSFRLDCPVATFGDDFHYGVEVRWGVCYVP